jgi:photosystem II stability/assembly factor-like uncharacterized protein
MRILIATRTGLVDLDPDSAEQRRALDGHAVTALTPASWEHLWAVVDGDQIWRSEGDGWQPVLSGGKNLEPMCLADTRAYPEDGILAGTTGARLARVGPKGAVEFIEGFDRAEGRESWFTPWGGPPATRTITEDGDAVYVNVHVGGILRSRDRGATWEPTIDVHADVHQVATGHGRVYAAGAGGLSISEDGGQTWRTLGEGLHATYCRAVAVCGEQVLLSASTGPRGGRAGVYRLPPGGGRLERSREGLPEWFAGNIDSLCLDALPDGRLAAFGTEAGEVFASTDQGESWRRLAAGLDDIRRVLVLP